MTAHLLPLFSPLPFITTTLPLSNSSLCYMLQKQTLLPITAKRSLAPSISVSNHPSPSILTALAKRPFLVPQQGGLIQQATSTKSAN